MVFVALEMVLVEDGLGVFPYGFLYVLNRRGGTPTRIRMS